MSKFRKLRKSKKITQVELSQKLNITQQAISMWESGTNMPPLEMVAKIAEVLDCDFLTVAECFVDIKR